MRVDLSQIFVWILPALQHFSQLARRRRIKLVFPCGFFHLRIGSLDTSKNALRHPSDTDHEQVSWIFGTLEDLVHGGNVILVGVIPLLQLLIDHACMAVSELKVMCQLHNLWFQHE